MSSKKTPFPSTFRAVGQRSLPSLFSSCPKNHAQVVGQDPNKGSHESLSESMERELHRTSAKPTTVKERLRPFSSVFGPRDLSESSDEKFVANKGGKAEKNNSVAALLAFEQSKHTDIRNPATATGVESSPEDVVQESRKRWNPFEGGGARKHFTVLGGDPKPSPKRRKGDESCVTISKAYNHYANGCGWWDSNREGVDNEEIGLNEVWEGVGSTTLGGIEWH